MLGFAVVDDNPETGALAVWLTSHTTPTGAGHTNAVIFAAGNRHVVKIAAMVADRYLVLSPRTEATVAALTSLPGQAVDIDELARETVKTQEDLEAQFRAWVMGSTKRKHLSQPRWPAVPAEVSPWNDGDPAGVVAMATANYVAAIWAAWLATEAERVQRRSFLIPDDAQVRQLPPGFVAAYKPLPVSAA
jgi:hypothetical protein